MIRIPSFRSTLGLVILAVVTACGGGGDGSDSSGGAPPTGPAQDPTAPAQFVAVGSSSRSVSLAWTAPAAATTYAIERQAGDAAYETVATVYAAAGQFLDHGLAGQTTYRYRLRSTDAAMRTLATTTAATSDEDPVVTPVGTPQGQPVSRTLGSAGGTLASPDGRITLDIPAGAWASTATVETQAAANTAPDGVDAAWRVRLSGLPARAVSLAVRYDEAQADEADGLRIALQRPDGSWLSLPLTQADPATRTLRAVVPAALLAAMPAPAAGARQGAASAAVGIEFTVVKYLAFRLKPAQARLAVNDALTLLPVARVRGYAMSIGTCIRFDVDIEACIMQPVMETREIPFLNAKAGYTRQWFVFAEEGGDATYGRIAATGEAGARYTAPAEVPAPETVLASFHSRHLASGRTMTLSARITIVDDSWTGILSAEDGPSIAGTTLFTDAHVTWKRDHGAGSATTRVYRPVGDLGVTVTDDDCTVSISPSVQPVDPDPRLGMLEIDDSTSPPTYRMRLITFFTAEIRAQCPKAGDTRTTRMAGWGWDVQGRVGADGSTIAGNGMQESAKIAWSFQR